jgi:hypothetical protein
MGKRKQVGFITMGASAGAKKIKEIYRTAEVCDAILRSAKSGRREAILSRSNKPASARKRV